MIRLYALIRNNRAVDIESRLHGMLVMRSMSPTIAMTNCGS